MVDNLRFGAINKRTDKWEDPTQASKKNKYKCPDCNKDVVFCKGKIVRPYFKHPPSKNNTCIYYDGAGESQLHKEGKEFMNNLLNNKKHIIIRQKCCGGCQKEIITHITEENYINAISKKEYRFTHKYSTKWADVALLKANGEFIMIFEIHYKHKTKEANRPDPWCEINVLDMLRNRDDIINNDIYEIICEREGCKCDDCTITHNAAVNFQAVFRGFASRHREYLDLKKAKQKLKEEIEKERSILLTTEKKIMFCDLGAGDNYYWFKSKALFFKRRLATLMNDYMKQYETCPYCEWKIDPYAYYKEFNCHPGTVENCYYNKIIKEIYEDELYMLEYEKEKEEKRKKQEETRKIIEEEQRKKTEEEEKARKRQGQAMKERREMKKNKADRKKGRDIRNMFGWNK